MKVSLVRILLLLVPALCVSVPAVAGVRADSVYRCIDDAIDSADVYFQAREGRIKALKERLGRRPAPAVRYEAEFKLWEEYRPLSNDSAIVYIEMAARTAAAMGDMAAAAKCKAIEAYQCSSSGMYMEAHDLLSSIDRQGLSGDALVHYYRSRAHLYGELGWYSAVPRLKRRYAAMQQLYIDSLLSVTDESHPLYLQYMEKRMYDAGDYYGALRYNDKWMRMSGHVPTEYAIIAYYRYLDYKMLGNEAEWTYWVAMSALADIRNGTTDQASMWELANHLYTVGDDKRAYEYIDFVCGCIEKFHTSMRSMQVLPVLSTISSKYQQGMASTNHTLWILVTVVSLFAMFILALLFYVNRQRKRLAQARNELSVKNEQLTALNADMKQAMDSLDKSNRQLTATGGRLNEAVAGLDESNRVKEKYIGLFLRQCSSYIDRMEAMRREQLALIKGKRYAELYDMVKKHDFRDKEQEELFEIFDSTFIRLFPTFVDEFNQLLRPDSRIVLPDQSKLTTGVRIFALIRLGIDDSSKIAEFLHYSVNTIYNYRAKIKNGAAVNRDDFEDLVKAIGSPKSVGGDKAGSACGA